MAPGGLAKLLNDSWTASGGVVAGVGEVLGVMLVPKMAAKSANYRKQCFSTMLEVSQLFFGGI